MPTDEKERLAILNTITNIINSNFEYETLFNLQRRRMAKATKLWQKAHPGSEYVLPDLGLLLDWLLSQIETLEERVNICDNYSRDIAEKYLKLVNYILPGQDVNFISLYELTEMAIDEHFRLKEKIVQNDNMINNLTQKVRQNLNYIKLLESKIHRQRGRLTRLQNQERKRT